MTQVLYGPHLSRQGKMWLGCSVAIFDEQGRSLLTHRADNDPW